MLSRRDALKGLTLLSTTTLGSGAFAFEGPLTDLAADAEEFAIAVDAYIYGYPLVTMELTRRVMTNVEKPIGTRGPMGQIIRLRSYPDATFRDVTAPNADTLYTTSFFDVGEEPWILSIPDMKGRYFLLPFLSGWTDVFQVPGTRTTGTQAQTFLISGPGWSGAVPAGMTQLKSPTSIVWLLGRIYCAGTPEDYAAVHALQDQFKLQPLSSWGKEYTPPAGKVDPSTDMKTAVREQVNAMTTVEYFSLLAELMKRNPPAQADAPALERFKRIGLEAGKSFDPQVLDRRWDKRVPALAQARIMSHFMTRDGDMTRINGWSYTTKAGVYGTSYLQRALVTYIGLGANRPQDAVYPTSLKPSALESYSGANKYVLRFAKGEMPPVRGFWSLTMYDENLFFVANPINRYSMSMRTNPKLEPDGSLVIYVQNESPGAEKEANWLPAPKGKFHLMMRLYWPDENTPSIIDGSWAIPRSVGSEFRAGPAGERRPRAVNCEFRLPVDASPVRMTKLALKLQSRMHLCSNLHSPVWEHDLQRIASSSGQGRVALQRAGPLVDVAPLLRELGCDPVLFGRRFGLDLLTLTPDARLPYATLAGLLDAAAKEANCPEFGLLLGSRAHGSAHGLLFELLSHAPTLRQALIDQMTWQLGYSSGAIIYLTRFGQDFALGYGIYDRASCGCAQVYDLAAAIFCNYIGVLTGGRVTPAEVLLCHREPEDKRAYQRLLKAPVRFNQNQCCVVLTQQALDTPLPGADPARRAAILREVEALQGPAYHDFVTRLRRIVRPLLLDETPSMVDAARALGLPVRTMRRRLADAGLTFEEVRDEVRFAFACELLTLTDLPVGDVAQALAFSTHSAFTTAFRRWSGHTPTEWRLHAGAHEAGLAGSGQFSVLDKPRPPGRPRPGEVHAPMAGE